jgi:hypothetical protein
MMVGQGRLAQDDGIVHLIGGGVRLLSSTVSHPPVDGVCSCQLGGQ